MSTNHSVLRPSNLIDRIDYAIDSRLPQSPDAIRRRKNRILIPLGATAGALALGGVMWAGIEITDNANGLEFSDTTTTYTLEANEGLSHVAAHVEGIEEVDTREVQRYILDIPENEAITADGLQPGDVFIIPESVKN